MKIIYTLALVLSLTLYATHSQAQSVNSQPGTAVPGGNTPAGGTVGLPSNSYNGPNNGAYGPSGTGNNNRGFNNTNTNTSTNSSTGFGSGLGTGAVPPRKTSRLVAKIEGSNLPHPTDSTTTSDAMGIDHPHQELSPPKVRHHREVTRPSTMTDTSMVR